MNPTPSKFIGSVGWSDVQVAEVTQIDRAILRNDGQELVVEFHDNDWLYTATLKHLKNKKYSGEWVARLKSQNANGTASCQLYDGPNGQFLFGRWSQDGNNFHWWGNLEPVEGFTDEAGGP